MEDVKRIYSLLLHSKGLKIREIAKELALDNYYVAEVLFSTQNILYWYQDDDGLWFAKDGAIQIEEPKEDKLTLSPVMQKRFNYDRYLQGDPSASLCSYIYNISKYRVCSNQEILDLISRYKKGDREALELIVKSQQRLVVGIAFLYRKEGVPLEELIQEGNMGLLKAIDLFDSSQSISFVNYAKTGIRRAISLSLVFLPYVVRLNLSQYILYRKIQRYKERYEQHNGYSPPVSDIKLNEDIDIIKIARLSQLPDDLNELIYIEDLDTFKTDSGEREFWHESLCKEINRAISTLTPREADVISHYFGLNGGCPMTLEEIGEKFDLTRERVRQIKEKAIRRLKHTSRSRILESYLDEVL